LQKTLFNDIKSTPGVSGRPASMGKSLSVDRVPPIAGPNTWLKSILFSLFLKKLRLNLFVGGPGWLLAG
jgi:hypothetical protein